MSPAVTVRYSNGDEEEFTPDRYERSSSALIMWRDNIPVIGQTEITIVNYNTTRWIRITDATRQAAGGFL